MKQLRQFIFWCHLAVGIAAGVVVLVMSVTGVLLTYQRQITAWADTRGIEAGPPSPGAARLPLAELVRGIPRGEGPATPSAIIMRPAPDAPVQLSYGRERTVFASAYTGAVLSEGNKSVRGFFRFVTDWHRWLGRADESREWGKAITGAANLGFLFLVTSGFYLWWPRNWARKAVGNVTLFRRGLSGKARDFNWHNVIGFWSAVPLFVVVLSGVVISYRWAGDAVYRVAGETPPPAAPEGGPRPEGAARPGGEGRPGGEARGAGEGRGGETRGGRGGGERAGKGGGAALVGIDALIPRAGERMPGWRILTLQLPKGGAGDSVRFTLDRGNGGEPQKRATLVLNRSTGAVMKWEPFASNTPGRRARMILRFAHTGEVLGIAGQTLAGLVSAGAAVLVWTGLFLSWRRLQAWRRRRNEPRVARPSPARDAEYVG